MKKNVFKWMLALAVLATPMVFTACGDDKTDSPATPDPDETVVKVTYEMHESALSGTAESTEFNATVIKLRTEMYTALYSSVGLTYNPSLPNPFLLVPATDETKVLNALDATYARLKDTDLKGGAYILTLRKDGSTLRTYNFGEEISVDGVRYAISFENAKLNSDKFWIGDETGTKTEGSNGPAWACTYTEGPATVNMTYGGSYWSGFAISACTGKTFASYSGTDQYNNVTGKAYKGDNFLVVQNAYGNESITFSTPVSILGFNYTNSAVAANSILNGDAISGEKFGADDFLTCTVTGLRKDGKTVTYDIELAKDGEYIDYWKSTRNMRTSFNNITKLTFSFKGSRNGEYGLNTPAYMCIDNIIVYAQE